jgi:hypothetical protein
MAETLTAHHYSMHHIRELHVSSQQKAASNFPCRPEEGVEESPITGFGKANPIIVRRFPPTIRLARLVGEG